MVISTKNTDRLCNFYSDVMSTEMPFLFALEHFISVSKCDLVCLFHLTTLLRPSMFFLTPTQNKNDRTLLITPKSTIVHCLLESHFFLA